MTEEDKKLFPCTMVEGVVDLALSQKIFNYHTMYPNDNRELDQVLRNIHHVDTYYEKTKYEYRIQGYIYIKDLPDEIPEELISANCNLAIKENTFIIEIWEMWLNEGFPF